MDPNNVDLDNDNDINIDDGDFEIDSEPDLDEDPIKAVFDRDIDDARQLTIQQRKSNLNDAGKKKEKLDFINKKKHEWKKNTQDGRNFLHHLAYYNYKQDVQQKPSIILQWLMVGAISRLSGLVGSLDNEKRSPLSAALSRGNEMFVHSMCKTLPAETREKFHNPLLKECNGDSESTCLHAATSCIFDNGQKRLEFFNNLCTFVPKEMFSVRDKLGRTPLHLAVEYDRCCTSQVQIVEQLLRSNPSALEMTIQDPRSPSQTLSAYQYHHYTRKRTEKKMAEGQQRFVENVGSQDDRIGASKKVDTWEEKKSDPKKDSRRVSARGEKAGASKTSMGPPPPRDISDANSKRRSSISQTPQGATTPVRTPILNPIHRTQTGTQPDTVSKSVQKARETAETANMISNLLKLESLRRQSPAKAAEDLQLHNEPVKEFWFDFGPPKSLSEEEFKKHFDHLKFDTALQYVAFPQICTKDDREHADVRYRGREDMVFFFDWLRNKSVTKIVKVFVEDMEPPSHRDEAIERCLKYFKVEVLDWKRLDLDSVTLCEIGANLREIHLQWSGSNNTLRAWSEQEALPSLPSLEVIHLIQKEGLESPERTFKNLQAFEERLNKFWPDGTPRPRVIRPKSGGGRPLARVRTAEAATQHQERPIDPHRWIECMQNFSQCFRQIKALREATGVSPSPVEVALIDDGVDITHPDLNDIKDRRIFGKSFDSEGGSSNNRVPPYWSSSSGHGTLMAKFIHKVCPSAIIHVIKLETVWAANSKKVQIKPESAIKAINYAAERGSQIICMSWTIKPPEGELRNRFNAAVQNAVDNHGILMFCSTSDQGKSADINYPHQSNRQCFRIGGAKATGTMLDTVGDPHAVDFIFPGHEVVISSREDDSSAQKFEPHTGSSVANALATGLAALVIECVRLSVIYNRELAKQGQQTVVAFGYSPIVEDDINKIRERARMEDAFHSIGVNQNTNHKYIEVWNTFDAVATNLKRSGTEYEKLRHIATLAEYFLKKGVK
ncbi:hypothetical protein ACHAP8_011620 [Fusarium lateritium]